MSKIDKSGYCHRLKSSLLKRWHKNEELLVRVNDKFGYSSKTCGSPRIRGGFQIQGFQGSRSRDARIMKVAGVRAIRSRKFVVTTGLKYNNPIAPNILNREFTTMRPGEVWVSDYLDKNNRGLAVFNGHNRFIWPQRG